MFIINAKYGLINMKVCKMKKKYIDMYSKREYNNSKKRDMRTERR
nr:MAG TPA: hypothetical protein [Bacteriophage sp.]